MSKELTPENILQFGLGYWGSKTFLSAIELGLFSELAKGPLNLDAVRARLKLQARSVRDFLDALVAMRMLERNADGKYSNTPERRRPPPLVLWPNHRERSRVPAVRLETIRADS